MGYTGAGGVKERQMRAVKEVAKDVVSEWVWMEAGNEQFDKGNVVSLGQHDAARGGGPR